MTLFSCKNGVKVVRTPRINNMHYNFQLYATIKSGSIAIAASTLDSLLDLMAGFILWFTHLAMKKVNIYKYPIGKLRMQPVGIVVFAAVMATLGMLRCLNLLQVSIGFFFFCHMIVSCHIYDELLCYLNLSCYMR